MTKSTSSAVSSQDLHDFLAAFNRIENLPATIHEIPTTYKNGNGDKACEGKDEHPSAHLAPVVPLNVGTNPRSLDRPKPHEQDIPFEDMF